MDEQTFAEKMILVLEKAKARLSQGNKFSAAFDSALELCRKAAAGEQVANNLQRIERLISDSVPWDDEFLSELNALRRELRISSKKDLEK